MAMQPFVWGRGGQALTPDQVERLRMSSALAAERGSDTSPVAHWSQGLARMVDAWGGYRGNMRANTAEEAGLASADNAIQGNPVLAALLGGDQAGMGQPSPVMNTSTSPVAAALVDGGLPSSLVQSESGGNWNALNSEGYGGRGQFGEARLADAARAGIIPAGMTGADYSRAPEQVQLAVENWHKGDILNSLGKYVGADIDGAGPIPPLTHDSILAVAHLGGTGGAQKFIESGGAYNPSDSNGTSLADYAMRHAGGGGAAGVPMPAQSQGPSPVLAALAQAQGNPWVAQKYGPVIQALMGQEMQRSNAAYEAQLKQQDPMYQAQLQAQQLELEEMRNPGPAKPVFEGGQWWSLDGGQPQALTQPTPEQTAAMQNYNFLIAQGVDPATAQQQAFGGNSVNVTNNMGGGKFDEEFAKGDAAAIVAASDVGMSAMRNMPRIDQLEALLSESPTGFAAAVAQRAGEWGVPIGEGLDTIQAAQAVINSMVPEQRPAGSGTMSDADLALFKQSLPRIINQPGGNQLIIDTMRAVNAYDAEGAMIAQRLRMGEIDRATAFDMLQRRENPLAGFKASQWAGGQKQNIPTAVQEIEGYQIEAMD